MRALIPVLAVLLAAGCTADVVGDAVFFCSADAPCGEGQTCFACPDESVHAGRSVCRPPGVDLVPRCGGLAADVDVMDTGGADTSGAEDTVSVDGGHDTLGPDGHVGPATPTIVASRDSGRAPLLVVFTVADLDPELEYRWDFDDPGGTWAFDGAPRGADVAAGAAHVFSAPGSHRITLTARDPAGATASASRTITVGDPSPELGAPVCFANAAGGASCPDGGTVAVGNFFDVLMVQSAAGKRRILLRRGDTFDAFSTSTVTAAGGELGAYGTGEAPRVVAHDLDVLHVDGDDWRIRDLAFSGGAAGVPVVVADADDVVIADVTHSGAGPLLSATGRAGVVAVDAPGADVGLASGAVLGCDVGRVTATGAPLIVAHSAVDGVTAGGVDCGGLGVIVDSEVAVDSGPAVSGGGCPAGWELARSLISGGDGVRVLGATRVLVHDAVVAFTGAGPGVRVDGSGAAVEQVTCSSAAVGATCVRIDAASTDAVVANVLLAAPASGTPLSDGGAGTVACGGCNVFVDAATSPFESAAPAALADYVPKAGSAPVDAGIALPRRRLDAGGRCRPAGGGWDAGAWERGASACAD